MNTSDKIAEKAIKFILVLAGFSLIFLILSPFFISPEEGSQLETLMLIPVIPIIMAGVILVVLSRSHYDTILSPTLRIIGFVIFILWIMSFFIDNTFR